MSKRILLASCALSLVVLAGCLGKNDGSTITAPQDTTKNNAKPVKPLTPGTYVGDYAYIPDSVRMGFESEFILNSDGSFRNYWVRDSDALYDQRGSWFQKDANLFFNHTTDSWVDYGVFSDFAPLEDDTNAIVEVTDSSFKRNEWIPILPRKRQWTTYHLANFPKVKEGAYVLDRVDSTDSIPKTVHFKLTLKDDRFQYSISDTVEKVQASAKYYQVGSFLAVEEYQDRTLDDSTKNFPETWNKVDGTILWRLRAVSDTAFSMWSPPYLDPGSWDAFLKHN